MIGITSKNKLITLKAGQRPNAHLIGVLITNPDDLTEEYLSKVKLRFHGPDGRLNQYRCLDALHIDPGQIDRKDDESPSQPQKSNHLYLSTLQNGAVFQIREHTKALERLWKYLSKKLRS